MVTETLIQRRPEYIEQREQLLLDRIFGTPTTDPDTGAVTYSGGILDAEQYPELFKIPEFKQAEQTALEQSVLNTFQTPEQRQAFMDRTQPYFMDESGKPRYLGDADSTVGTGVTTIASGIGGFDPTTVSKFMNPYEDQVIQAAIKDIDEQGAIAMNRDAAQTARRGLFGNARSALRDAATEGKILDAKNKAISGIRQAGYTQALGAAQKAFEDEQKRDLEAGRLYGGLGQAYGQLAGTSADIGRVYAAQAPADLGFMYELGGSDRAYGQTGLDVARANQLRQTDQALAPLNYAYGALSGTPSAGVYNTYGVAPQPNAALAGIGAYTALQGINQQRT
jgi:hypothetical protein